MSITDFIASERGEKLLQFLKYCIVGVLNTIVTFAVIYICKSFLGWNLYVSNVLGYVAGVANSFLCNKSWVFKSKGGYYNEALRFLIGFLVCYLIQLWVVWAITARSPIGQYVFSFFGFVISGYGIATIVGNVVYTLANFIYNRMVTFRARGEQ